MDTRSDGERNAVSDVQIEYCCIEFMKSPLDMEY